VLAVVGPYGLQQKSPMPSLPCWRLANTLLYYATKLRWRACATRYCFALSTGPTRDWRRCCLTHDPYLCNDYCLLGADLGLASTACFFSMPQSLVMQPN